MSEKSTIQKRKIGKNTVDYDTDLGGPLFDGPPASESNPASKKPEPKDESPTAPVIVKAAVS